jgi:hypothetical protein
VRGLFTPPLVGCRGGYVLREALGANGLVGLEQDPYGAAVPELRLSRNEQAAFRLRRELRRLRGRTEGQERRWA